MDILRFALPSCRGTDLRPIGGGKGHGLTGLGTLTMGSDDEKGRGTECPVMKSIITALPEEPPEKNDLFFHRLRGLTVRVGPHGTGRARADASPGRVSALHTGTLGPATGCQGSGHARYALRSVSQPVGLGGRKRADTDFELACDPEKNLSTGSFCSSGQVR